MALKHLLGLASVVLTARAQSTSSTAAACPSSIAPAHGAPSVAPGFRVQVVANNLRDPRGIQFDSAGGLLVVEQGHGISRLPLSGDGACVRQNSPTQLNHGIALSQDGRTLYASSHSNVYAWTYDAQQGRVSGESRDIVEGMGDDEGHTTRTLLLSAKEPSLLLVSRGSVGNIDPQTVDVTTGVSTIKAFNISNITDSAYQHARDGLLLGWGLRNSVGVAEDPVTGAIYSVENSVDNIQRDGQTINQNNPGEELNFHGYLNGSGANVQGENYGYPSCFAAWNVSEIPDNTGLRTGTNFAIGTQNATVNDDVCQQDRIAPRITFNAHMAPLDIKFNTNGTGAWVTMHGSWNRQLPIGYKLSFVEFDGNGQPRAPANSTTAAADIVSNPDLTRCPTNCFRPVGLAWDSQGRLYMSSDSTGEIYVITKTDGSGVNDVRRASSSGASGSPTGSAPTPSSSNSRGIKRWKVSRGSYWVAGAAVVGGIPLI
ncbi:soluble quino protein glucose dehydrogenase [Setomelanomma holmii]|uniref:Soluble quino protein glucose dehydrogenase n=1 Tax=Setomelanomma holmii TaxID=210430 RepID=A0A9P4HAF7_9PLEO|nr:soluble quino protein glucose dehydrogenase [Setomelanomma holmii]